MTVIRKADARAFTLPPEREAYLGGAFSSLMYSDTGGLTQFGAFVETLAPGARSSDRHWHEAEDEFLYMIEGTATLVEDDGATEIGPGDCCTWKAGVAVGHHVLNRSDAPVRYLVIGTRAPADVAHYSDIDKITTRHPDGRIEKRRRDGSALPEDA